MDTGKLVKFEGLPVQGQYDQRAMFELLHQLTCIPGLAERLAHCLDRMPEIDRCVSTVEDRCRRTVSRCDSLEMLCQLLLCPGNILYSQKTLNETASKSIVKVNEIVQNFGPGFVNAYPVAPGQKIRLVHKPRPGFTPTKIRIDMNLAGGANNYSDFTIQFYVVPGGVNSGLGYELGNEYDGNSFLNKDGSQIEVDFPTFNGHPIDIGSLETLAVVITHNGPANNLDSAHVNVHYDNRAFYEHCKRRCGCSESAC